MRLPRWLIVCALIASGLAGLVGYMFWLAQSMPVVRTADVILPFPPGTPPTPLRVALITDTHLSGPDNSPERLARIFDRVNAMRPDLILLGGDYVSRNKPFSKIYSNSEMIAPLARLKAPLGVVAVLGNHEISHFDGSSAPKILTSFQEAGIRLLMNEAVRRGPLVIGGIPDFYKNGADVPATIAAMRRLGGAPIFLSHNVDAVRQLGGWRGLVVAGHSHCGQIALPFYGPLFVPQKLPFTCGRYDIDGKTIIVSGGVGTSSLPLRLAAPPDIWIITIRPAN
ncbi:metallophosphoesterase [Sphingobium phenoxybenzoativorans]|uniref:metallophosphoesterase n=1 Tax=Sphingobium phenoxybenzoativorans TaxID=1592790 RepID=UPI000872BECA|nr:metallophosphoesterase [Sphingobium phenoxybenzoativorans]